MNRNLKTGISILFLAASALGAYNVFADNTEVEHMAETAACAVPGGTQPCKPQKTYMARNPIGQTFEYQAGNKRVRIRCARAFVLAGAYSCSPE